jgi:hypothetical protein
LRTARNSASISGDWVHQQPYKRFPLIFSFPYLQEQLPHMSNHGCCPPAGPRVWEREGGRGPARVHRVPHRAHTYITLFLCYLMSHLRATYPDVLRVSCNTTNFQVIYIKSSKYMGVFYNVIIIYSLYIWPPPPKSVLPDTSEKYEIFPKRPPRCSLPAPRHPGRLLGC